MTSTQTRGLSDYLRVLLRSGLLRRSDVEHQVQEFRHSGRTQSPQAFGSYLLQQGLITSWQHEKLLSGKHRGFFLGKYKLLRHIGSGGMSRVFLAEHIGLQRQVALKILPSQWVDDPSYLQRFLLEARAIAALNHPNIVQAYDVGNEEKTYYMAIEYIEGQDLRRYIRSGGPLSPEQAADFIRQAAEGLSHAHGRGMVHRDVKPSNLLLDQGGVVRILDLGMARLLDMERSITLEHNERVLGTADYLSPEQAINSHEVDHRTDLYSLGCTFYYLLAGQVPFPKGTLAQRLMKHQSEDPQPIETQRNDVPQVLLDLQRKMVAKHPDERVQTASEVADTLALYLGSAGPVVLRRSQGIATAESDVSEARLSTVKLQASDTTIEVEPELPVVVERDVPTYMAKKSGWRSPYLAISVALFLGLAMVPFLLWSEPVVEESNDNSRAGFSADVEKWPGSQIIDADTASTQRGQNPQTEFVQIQNIRCYPSRLDWRSQVRPLEVFAMDTNGLAEFGLSTEEMADRSPLAKRLTLHSHTSKRLYPFALVSQEPWMYLGGLDGIGSPKGVNGNLATLECSKPTQALGIQFSQARQPLDGFRVYGADHKLLADVSQATLENLFAEDRRKTFLGFVAEAPIHSIEIFGKKKSSLALHDFEFAEIAPTGEGNLIVNGSFASPIVPWIHRRSNAGRGQPSDRLGDFALPISGRMLHDVSVEAGVHYVFQAKFCFASVRKLNEQAGLQFKIGKRGSVDAQSSTYNVVPADGVEQVELGTWHTAEFDFVSRHESLQIVIHLQGYNQGNSEIWVDDLILRKIVPAP